LLANWERERRTCVTIDDVRRRVGPRAATNVARHLVRKGALQRVRRGIYLVRPFRSLLRPIANSSATSVAALLQNRPYYLGGLWAFGFHRLTQQEYASSLDVFVTSRLLPRQLGAARVSFHVVPRTHLRYGIVQSTTEGAEIRVSDVERTLLDALDHPATVGNVRSGLALFQEGLPRADQRRLVAYASLGSRNSTCQRLGVLLERAGAAPRSLTPLRERARGSRSLLSMLPGTPRTGPVNKRWNVVENDQ
jgi:predicted transcriptional regulator of viral defense system